MYDHATLRPAAALLGAGFVTHVTVTFLHTGGPANEHDTIFEHYAASGSWLPVHLAQFVAMAAMVAGLYALSTALRAPDGTAPGPGTHLARAGSAVATVALALYGALQAIDGVALQHAVDAWIAATDTEKEARFAAAETVRWLEWGLRSYHTVAFAGALLLLGAAGARSRRLPATVAVLMVLSALPYLLQGWVVGAAGFTDLNSAAIVAAYPLMLAWIGGLATMAWRSARSRENAPTTTAMPA